MSLHYDSYTDARASEGSAGRCREGPCGWSVFIPGLPVSADGATFDEAITEMVDARREYAEDWQDRLLDAPNHRENWGPVQLISLSDDDQLREWIVGSAR